MQKDYPAMLHRFSIQKQAILFTLLLIPLIIAGIIYYGLYVLWILLVAFISCFIVEWMFSKLNKKKMNITFIVTPVIFTLLLPPTLPLWIVAVGSAFGVFFGKAIFGGFGKNIFNPAIVGRLFITISFPAYMATMWLDPKTDAITTATPLGVLNKGSEFTYPIQDLLLGNVPGSIGETFRIGIIIIGLILIVLRIVNWRIPVAVIGSVFVFTWLGHLLAPNVFEDPMLSILVGSVLFGAFFIASDPITSPYTQTGRVLYGIGIGIITIIIRNFAAFPEGTMFAIIIMNGIAPQLDSMVIASQNKRSEVI